mgnify:CR=1 FL=1
MLSVEEAVDLCHECMESHAPSRRYRVLRSLLEAEPRSAAEIQELRPHLWAGHARMLFRDLRAVGAENDRGIYQQGWEGFGGWRLASEGERMSDRLTLRFRPGEREVLDRYASTQGFTLSQAVRYLAILGAGGSRQEADTVNRDMAETRDRLRAAVGGRRWKERARSLSPTMAVRFPGGSGPHFHDSSAWASRVRDVGGLRQALQNGMRIEGRRWAL